MTTLSKNALIERIEKSYHQLSGKNLPSPHEINDRPHWLDNEAPYGLLAHGTGDDPLFIYANKTALATFKYSAEQMLQLPSRLSADTADQKERQQMLDSLITDGIFYGYSGTRITRDGTLFQVFNGTIWNLLNEDGTQWGQAALIWLSEKETNFGCTQ